MKWISVKDRLPEEDQDLLLFDSYIEIGYFDGKNFMYSEVDRYGYIKASGVTHWMPLPEEPKGVVGE
jgi:hypothetical protein